MHLSSVQTWLTKQVTQQLSHKLHTKVDIKRVHFSFFYQLELEDLLINDRSGDTLLFAGAAKVNVNDWFFSKDHIVLKYIGLNNGLINLKRKTKEWNYQFMADYFSSSDDTKKTTDKNIEFDLKQIELTQIRFNYIDQWKGEDMIFSVGKMDVAIKQTDWKNKKISIGQLKMSQPHFIQNDYEGNRPDSALKKNTAEELSKIIASQKKEKNWSVELNEVILQEGIYQNEIASERKPYVEVFDENHILFTSVNATIKNVSVLNDSITGELSLSAKEKCGLLVKQLNASVTFTPQMMEFKKLDLHTNKSHLGNYYSMRYTDFNEDMKNFISNVTLEGHFSNSEVNSDDIALFAPELISWKRNFNITGEAVGTIENFSIQKMAIKTGETTLTGNVDLRGLPDIDHVYIDYSTDFLQTNFSEISTIFPELRNVPSLNFKQLGNIRYKGNFTGYLTDFVTYGTLNTNLGNIHADINMKLPEKGKPTYSGKISIDDFKMGAFTYSNKVGNVSINGDINGSGFSLQDLNASFKGDISKIVFNGYQYQRIKANGYFKNETFTGHLSIDDPNMKINAMEGVLSLNENKIAFNLQTDLQYAHLRNIHLTEQNLSLKGHIQLDFTGNTIDDFLGAAKMSHAVLKNNNDSLSLDYLSLHASMADEIKSLSFETTDLNAAVKGHFKIKELPEAFKVFLSKYYPTFIKQPSLPLSNQEFSFNLVSKNIAPYLNILKTKFSGFNNSSISGNIDIAKNELNAQINIPEWGYEGKSITDFVLNSSGDKDTLTTVVSIGDIKLSDSLHLPGTKLLLKSGNDISEIHLTTSASNTLNEASLNASVQTFSDGVEIHFSPSSLIVNNRDWQLQKDGELSLRNNIIKINEINFSHKNQAISIETLPSTEKNEAIVVANITSLNLNDIMPLIIKNPELKGTISGKIIITDPLGKNDIDFKGEADSLFIENEYLGNVNLGTTVQSSTGLISYHANNIDTSNIFSIEGTYNLKDSGNNQLSTSLVGKKIQLSILRPYLSDIFSKVDGIATSNLKISGNNEHQIIVGDVLIKKAKIEVDYTKCSYTIENQLLTFDKDLIDLGLTKIKDSLDHTGTIKGKIHHRFFDDFSFENVRLETDKLSLLHTHKSDNSSFYGNIIGRAVMNLNGPVTDMKMDIKGEPSYLDSSHIYLSTADEKETNTIDYIEFMKYGSQMEETKVSKKTNIVVSIEVKATPSCKVDVILDEETGDIIKGQGNGLIKIKVGNNEPLSIRGDYTLTKGEYTFNFQTFLKKPFTLNNGTITWNGDPYQANINIDAEYLAKNVDISNLSPTGGFKQKEDVTIISHLTGVLQNPLVKFDFQLPEKSEAKNDDLILKRLAEFKNDDNEMNKQVASLLLFNTFIIGNQNFLSQGNASTILTNTIGGIVSNLLSNFLNKELGKITKGMLSTYIDINPSLGLEKSVAQLQANVRAGLKILLSNRLVVLVGGNLDYNNSSYTQQLERKGLLTPDITIEWLLNKEGTIRVVGFNRSSIDFTLNQRNRSGLQLSFRKDINRISDLLKSRKKLLAEEAAIINNPQIKIVN